MNSVFALIMLVDGTIAGYFALQQFFGSDRKFFVNKVMILFAIASAVWSFGFSALFMQTDPKAAYYCRSTGMIGVFLYLIAAQFLIGYISEIRLFIRVIMAAFSCLGIGVYFLTILPDQTVYYMSDWGMTYHFESGPANSIYTMYTVIVAANMFAISIHMIMKASTRRLREFGKYFLITEILMLFGMVLDTIFPLLGVSAIPGSSVTQFWGFAVLQYAVAKINHSRITIPNMSEFVYYSLSSPVLVYDMKRNIKIMNDAADSFFHVSRAEIEKKNLMVSDLFAVDNESVFFFEGEQQVVDTQCRDTQVYCTLTVNKIRDTYGDIIGYIIVVTDQTERVKAMRALDDARIESERANRAKSVFLANMSHEIRTPMNAIIGFSELLLKENLSETAHEYVEDVFGSANNLLAIINDVLDISKIESGKMELVCEEYRMSDLLGDVCHIIEPLAQRKNLAFEVELDKDIPNGLYGDQTRIRSVLVNILNNAVKYTAEGTVRFRIRKESVRENEVFLRFEVEDTGIGIKTEDLGTLFDSFSQLDKKMNRGIEGTGLGLAIVKGYVEMMNGEVSVESVYRKGSTFTVRLTQHITDPKPMQQISFATSEKPENSEIGEIKIPELHVLVVDDNPINLKVIEKALACYEIAADTASSGAKAIALCEKKDYPIVWMDQMMPEMDGVEAMQRIRSLRPYYEKGGTAKIIALTANAISGAREELLEAGFDDYLSKPIDFKKLEEILMSFTDDEKEFALQNAGIGIPGVDTEKGMLLCGGTAEDYNEILAMMYEASEGQRAEVSAFFEEGNYKSYTIAIHAMKGQLYNIGAQELGDYAKELEFAGKEENSSFISENLPEFCRRYDLLMKDVAVYLERQGIRTEIVKPGDLQTLLQNLVEQMENFDFAGADETIKAASGLAQNDREKELVESIKKCVENIDVDGVLALVRQQ